MTNTNYLTPPFKVRCIDDLGSLHRLKNGEVYEVIKVDFVGNRLDIEANSRFYLKGKGSHCFYKSRFEIIPEEQKATPDIFNIATPFGLLPVETQEALKAWNGVHEFYSPSARNLWVSTHTPIWDKSRVYRAVPLPEPVKSDKEVALERVLEVLLTHFISEPLRPKYIPFPGVGDGSWTCGKILRSPHGFIDDFNLNFE